MMKLGGRCIVQKSWPSSNLGVITPWVRTPKNVTLGYDVGKISAGCVSSISKGNMLDIFVLHFSCALK